MSSLEEKEMYLDPHSRPNSQIDFRWMKFKIKSTFKKYEKIEYQIYGTLSKLEEMTKKNVDNPTISKWKLFYVKKNVGKDAINRKCLHIYMKSSYKKIKRIWFQNGQFTSEKNDLQVNMKAFTLRVTKKC